MSERVEPAEVTNPPLLADDAVSSGLPARLDMPMPMVLSRKRGAVVRVARAIAL